jgi:hypothetical protein
LLFQNIKYDMEKLVADICYSEISNETL